MRGVWELVRRDARHVRANAIALVVFVGIVAVPSFYAWFNIAGSWDPYGNTGNIRVAVANEDEGYSGELVPLTVNMGERVVAELQGSDSIGYVVTSEADAVEGVRSGEYYAAVVIPPDFSRDMMTTFSADPVRAEVRFYQNEKANAIATIVTDKASSAVMAQIDSGFAEAVSAVGAGALKELGSALDDDAVTGLAARLDAAVTDSADALSGTAGSVRDFADLLESTRGLLGSGAGVADAALSPAADAGEVLRETASGLAGAGSAIDDAETSVAGALESAGAGLDGVDAAIDDALDVAGAQEARIQKGLSAARDAVGEQIDALERLDGALGEQLDLMRELEGTLPEGSPVREGLGSAIAGVGGLRDRVDRALVELRDLSDGLGQTMGDLDAGAADAEEARERLKGLVDEARTAVGGAGQLYDDEVRGSLGNLAGQVAEAAEQADAIEGNLAGTLAAVGSAAKDASDGLAGARDDLDETADSLDAAAEKLDGLHERLRSALDSGDARQVREVLASGPEGLAEFVAAPVSVERTAVFPVENNGSAMAPFYTTLAIWIGGVVLAALVRAKPSEAALEETGCSHAQAYVGRLALFVVVGLAQAALICGGDLFYLGVQCEHPWLMLLACLASSLVYVNLIFSLTASFGDVGKAVAVVLMVVQVAGSGGTFPPEMLPAPFQAVYSWLPFVHSEAALRAAMFGVWDGDFWRELGVLLAYLVPALLLGLVLRRPVIRLNEWFEHRLERTRLM